MDMAWKRIWFSCLWLTTMMRKSEWDTLTKMRCIYMSLEMSKWEMRTQSDIIINTPSVLGGSWWAAFILRCFASPFPPISLCFPLSSVSHTLTTWLRYNSHAEQLTHLNCTVQYCHCHHRQGCDSSTLSCSKKSYHSLLSLSLPQVLSHFLSLYLSLSRHSTHVDCMVFWVGFCHTECFQGSSML